MDDREFEKILASAEQLRLREKETAPWADRYSDIPLFRYEFHGKINVA